MNGNPEDDFGLNSEHEFDGANMDDTDEHESTTNKTQHGMVRSTMGFDRKSFNV